MKYWIVLSFFGLAACNPFHSYEPTNIPVAAEGAGRHYVVHGRTLSVSDMEASARDEALAQASYTCPNGADIVRMHYQPATEIWGDFWVHYRAVVACR